jgi:asparagine synthase (glutamine-hydrolysing)
MCGIAGIAGAPDPALVRRMTDALAHRGPDAAGHHDGEGVSLGHRRLSVIDLEGGAQPMASPDGRHWLVYNGEIYNFRELRAELSARGHVFRTQSDTEVLLAAYVEHGAACVGRLRGMFAFAVWDAAERSLFLARDPVGVKPLYYAEAGGALYFGSEIKAPLCAPAVPRHLDFAALDDYLTYLHTVPPRTFYSGVRQLPPGHWARWQDGRLEIQRYWRLRVAPETRSEADWLEELDQVLDDTVGRHLISDVPLGAFLSGGLDSSAIVHHMARHAARPHTFTVGFGGEGALYDETGEARALARHFGTDHHELRVDAAVGGMLPVLLRHFDEPFGNPTALLTHQICGLVRGHVTVILSGDGGDEGFGGYPRHAGALLAERYRRVPLPLRRALNPLVQLLPESTRGFHALRRIRDFSAGSLCDPLDMYARWLGHSTPADRAALYTGDTRRAVGDHDSAAVVRHFGREAETDDPALRAMHIDIHTFLPNNVLHYGDRMSMAHGLETRVPLADHRLLEFLARVPRDLKVSGREGKVLLRRHLARALPPADVRRPKRGFNPPMGVWLNGPLRAVADDHLAPGAVRARGLFEPGVVARMIREHRDGRRDHTWRLWALIVLEAWCRTQ